MFGRKKKPKKKQLERPLGVTLRIELNLATIEEVAKTREPPNISDMTNTWDIYNYVHREFRLAFINSLDNKIVIFCGADGNLYRDLGFEIALPYPVGPNRTEELLIESVNEIVRISIDDIPLIVFPLSNIIDTLIGTPLLDTGKYTDSWGEDEELSYQFILDGVERPFTMTMIARIAQGYFTYRNRAIKIQSSQLMANHTDPLDLSMTHR